MKIAICDDNKNQIKEIEMLLREQQKARPDIEFQGFTCCSALLATMENGTIYDLIFLDIEMPEINGVELAEKIKKSLPFVMVFFISSHKGYISDAFYLNASQFLVKPIDPQRFNKEFDRLYEKYAMLKKTITIPKAHKNESKVFPISDIICIETNKRQLIFHTKSGDYECYGSFSSPQTTNLPNCFLQVHRAFIINMHRIESVGVKEIACENNIVVPISRNLRDKVKYAIAFFKCGGVL